MSQATVDYYATLGVSRNASEAEIRSAFRKKAQQSHPDLHPNDPKAAERFKAINEAYEVLGDAEKRKKYDTFGASMGAMPQGQSFGGFQQMDAADLDDLFGHNRPFSDFFYSMFGDDPIRFGSARTDAPRRQAPAVEGEVAVTVDEACRGAIKRLELSVGGKVRVLDVRIPKGMRDGGKIRLPGQGGEKRQRGAPDVVLTVRVQAHDHYRLEGDTIIDEIRVPLKTMLVGGRHVMTGPQGESLDLSIPQGAQTGTRLRLKGHGFPATAKKPASDLIVKLLPDIPPLSDQARARITEYL